MKRVIILGSGGHGQVVANILAQAAIHGSPFQAIGFLDDNPAIQGEMLLGLEVLGYFSDLKFIDHDAVVVAIGNNHRRQQLFDDLRFRGERFAIARHPTAIIAPDVKIGPGTVISAGVIINPGSTVGANVILNTGCTLDHHNRIGDHAHIAPGSHLGGDVHIGDGALVGIGAIVMPQRRTGPWSVLGAGALAQSDVESHVVAVGVPARVIKINPGEGEPEAVYASHSIARPF